MGETSFPGGAGHVGSTHQTQGEEGQEEVEGVWEEGEGKRAKGKVIDACTHMNKGVVRFWKGGYIRVPKCMKTHPLWTNHAQFWIATPILCNN